MELYLTPTLTAGIVYLLGLAIAIGYLIYLPQKTRDSKLILALLTAWFCYGFVSTFYQITHTHLLISGPGYENGPWQTYSFYLGLFAFLLFLVVLLFRIGFSFSIWEERILSGVIVLALLYTTARFIFNAGETNIVIYAMRTATQVALGLSGWIVFAGLRKLWVAYRRNHDFRSKRLVTMMALTSIAAFLFISSISYLTIVWFFSAEMKGIIPALMGVAVAGLLIIGYLLYSPEKHSLQVKLVGFLVLVYISIFSVIIPFMRTEVSLRQSFQGTSDIQTLIFVPDSVGAYTVEYAPSRWISPSGPGFFASDDSSVPVRSAFSFPFYGAEYDSVWVGTNGSISFGQDIDADETFSSGLSFFDEIPSAMPMYSDLLMVGADANIIVDAAPERFLVTWNDMSLYDLNESTLTMQAALYPDGMIEFNYADITSLPLLRFVGISPGGPADPIRLDGSFTSAAPGQALFEYYDQRDAFRRFVHPIVVPVAWIGIIGLFLVLIGGIVFYRIGILNPLDRVLVGLRAVEKGNLDTEVVIAERNELGALADHFNRMTTSIREYNVHLEDMVEDRTSDLRATQAQLVEQEKLASLGSLTAGIAHEIKNPLNFVNNFAEVSTELVEELSEAIAAGRTDEAQSILEAISENAVQIAKHGRRADSIVKSMMQHARGGTSVPENVHLNSFLGEYVDLAWHGRRAREPEFQTDVIRRFDEAVGDVHIQPQELGRVILNLLNNAFDALKGIDGAQVTMVTHRAKGYVEIIVEDNGPGIPQEIREKIFEPFFTTKASGEGTGLGLSLSYDIVTKGHGGTMKVEASPERGAKFVITLPS